MASRNRFKELEQMMTRILIADVVVFGLFLLFAGLGVAAMKVICAIVTIIVSGLCLAFLYMTGVTKKRAGLWMVVGFASVLVCLLVSLICNYPSPLK
ncbi:MAG: hypothetical protein IJZ39_08740 [Oscillospiraceae bacterium]|nr:hypothetical protein [Oscillospiraceae bacterium]